jgi:hypothetical protein
MDKWGLKIVSEDKVEKQKGAVHIPASQMKTTFASNYVSFYCNNVQYAVNSMDFVLIFGEVSAIDDEGTPSVEQRARVTMTPVEALILRSIITRQINIYEAKLGRPMEVPPDVKEAIRLTEQV